MGSQRNDEPRQVLKRLPVNTLSMHLQELRGTKDEIEERINTIAQQIAGALLLPRADTPVIPVSCVFGPVVRLLHLSWRYYTR